MQALSPTAPFQPQPNCQADCFKNSLEPQKGNFSLLMGQIMPLRKEPHNITRYFATQTRSLPCNTINPLTYNEKHEKQIEMAMQPTSLTAPFLDMTDEQFLAEIAGKAKFKPRSHATYHITHFPELNHRLSLGLSLDLPEPQAMHRTIDSIPRKLDARAP